MKLYTNLNNISNYDDDNINEYEIYYKYIIN